MLTFSFTFKQNFIINNNQSKLMNQLVTAELSAMVNLLAANVSIYLPQRDASMAVDLQI